MSASRRELFNSSSLDGWMHVGEGTFHVVDGCLRTDGGMGLLWYREQRFGDCRIRISFRTHSRSANSGVFIRIADEPGDPWYPVHNGYEVQTLADGDPWHRTGCIYTMTRVETTRDRAPGEWNEMAIDLDGERIRVTLNDSLVTDFDPATAVPPRRSDTEPERKPRPRDGYVGLQNHDTESVVDFRTVVVEPLPAFSK